MLPYSLSFLAALIAALVQWQPVMGLRLFCCPSGDQRIYELWGSCVEQVLDHAL